MARFRFNWPVKWFPNWLNRIIFKIEFKVKYTIPLSKFGMYCKLKIIMAFKSKFIFKMIPVGKYEMVLINRWTKRRIDNGIKILRVTK